MRSLSLREARRLTERLRLFAQAQRLLILALLLDGPYSVSVLREVTGMGQSVLSQQLGALRRADIIRGERRSRMIFYDFRNEKGRHQAWMLLAALGVLPLHGRVATLTREVSPEAEMENAGAIFSYIENSK